MASGRSFLSLRRALRHKTRRCRLPGSRSSEGAPLALQRPLEGARPSPLQLRSARHLQTESGGSGNHRQRRSNSPSQELV